MSLTNASSLEAATAARAASRKLAILSTEDRNNALTAIHDALAKVKESILLANKSDLIAASDASERGELSQSILKRLDLTRPGKWEDMLQGILDVRNLEDPIGRVDHRMLLDDDLVCQRRSTPIGVLLIIFEARPEVIANIASLAIKSGNAAILKGGSETTESFQTISRVISRALSSTAVPNDALQLVTSRSAVSELLALDSYIDLVIPRGSNSLVSYCKKHASIPVLGHADGLCTIYLCADADPSIATKVIFDSKTNYPAACNSIETLLVEEAALTTVLPPVVSALLQKGVRLRCDPDSKAALSSVLDKHQATFLQPSVAEDYDTEFLDLILAVKTIPSSSSPSALDAAISHINTHGSHHTDAILTSSSSAADTFLKAVDSACVFWNTSTRMADGQRFGFGTEVGISTNKIHARGPVGLEGLTIYKYEVRGKGQVAGDYGAEGRGWRHEKLLIG
ncbi:MAG: hypothetical protein M1820_008305 [Bogoriella megaspora]|nr:MAG: hypothetical protein M1820_008305 [Bogoriella megaspora]